MKFNVEEEWESLVPFEVRALLSQIVMHSMAEIGKAIHIIDTYPKNDWVYRNALKTLVNEEGWLTEGEVDNFYSFESICLSLDLNSEIIRKGIYDKFRKPLYEKLLSTLNNIKEKKCFELVGLPGRELYFNHVIHNLRITGDRSNIDSLSMPQHDAHVKAKEVEDVQETLDIVVDLWTNHSNLNASIVSRKYPQLYSGVGGWANSWYELLDSMEIDSESYRSRWNEA